MLPCHTVAMESWAAREVKAMRDYRRCQRPPRKIPLETNPISAFLGRRLSLMHILLHSVIKCHSPHQVFHFVHKGEPDIISVEWCTKGFLSMVADLRREKIQWIDYFRGRDGEILYAVRHFSFPMARSRECLFLEARLTINPPITKQFPALIMLLWGFRNRMKG